MTAAELGLPAPAEALHSAQCGPLTVPRYGIMLHFDDSSSDAGAVAWFTDPRCHVSYNALVLDDGRRVDIAPWDRAAWHAGVCLPGPWGRSANAAFYGVAAATNAKVPVTAPQLDAIVAVCAALFRAHRWPASEAPQRIVGHDMLACFPKGHPKAGQLGRKIDPTGYDLTRPILSVLDVRRRVDAALRGAA